MDSKEQESEITQRSDKERVADLKLKQYSIDFLTKNPAIASSPHWNWHYSLFLRRQTLSRILYLDFLYKQIIDVPGVILEFGVQHGATLSVLANLRGIYEPYNHSRKIIGFDTFSGFVNTNLQKDAPSVQDGQYSVAPHWEKDLNSILALQQEFSPISHIKKFELVDGDVTFSFENWLKDNPGLTVAMAIFDMDIYEPTRRALELVRTRMTRNTILVFDEFSCSHFAGETIAAQEIFGLNNLELQRTPLQPFCAFGKLRFE